MIRCGLLDADAQKSPQTQRIRRPPSDSSLGIDPFKIAHQQQTKIDSRRQRRPAYVVRVKLRALPLGKLIASGCTPSSQAIAQTNTMSVDIDLARPVISPDGRYVVFNSDDNDIWLYDSCQDQPAGCSPSKTLVSAAG